MKLTEKLDPELRCLIKQVNPRSRESALKDSYGRCTYFYIMLGD